MSDNWLDSLDPDELREWERFVENVRRDTLRKMTDSAFVMSLIPRGDPDIKFAVELGLAIMLDKPIMALVLPGAQVPKRLRVVADEIVEADIDTEAGQQIVAAALERMKGRL